MKKTTKIVLSIMIVLSAMIPYNTIAESSELLMQPGEYLEYEVSFMGVTLGTVKMYVEKKESINDILAHKAKAVIKSAAGIPFVELDATFNTWIDPKVSHSHKFTSNTKISEGWEFQQLDFDYPNQQYHVKKWKNKKIEQEKTIKSPRKWNDGAALFYLARNYLYHKKTVRIPTIISGDTNMTTINFSGKKESVDIDAVKYPVSCVYFNGQADWEGLYGLSGKFEGWFSDDDARVPIQAKMNVYVGKVTIELVKWKREGWTPPKGNS